jgi:hypothetical protein
VVVDRFVFTGDESPVRGIDLQWYYNNSDPLWADLSADVATDVADKLVGLYSAYHEYGSSSANPLRVSRFCTICLSVTIGTRDLNELTSYKLKTEQLYQLKFVLNRTLLHILNRTLTAVTFIGAKVFLVLNTTINIKDIFWIRWGNNQIWRTVAVKGLS